MAKGKVLLVVVESGEKGSSKSGNYGHAGRPGKVGGSVVKGGGAVAAGSDLVELGKYVQSFPKYLDTAEVFGKPRTTPAPVAGEWFSSSGMSSLHEESVYIAKNVGDGIHARVSVKADTVEARVTQSTSGPPVTSKVLQEQKQSFPKSVDGVKQAQSWADGKIAEFKAKPATPTTTGSVYKQAQAQAGRTLGNVPLGVPQDVHVNKPGMKLANNQILSQHIERKSGFHIKDDTAVKTSANQKVRTTIKPDKYDPKKLEVTHEVKQGNDWVPSFKQPYQAKTEYDAFRMAMIDHASLVAASNRQR